MGTIYKITNKVNGKTYIGLTTRKAEVRFNEHIDAAINKNHHLYLSRSIRKYGAENFELSIIEDNVDIEKLGDREIYWINRLLPEYNTSPGGDMGRSGCVLAKIIGDDYDGYRLIKSEEFNKNRHLYEHFSDNKVVAAALNTNDGRYMLVDRKEFHANRDKYIAVGENKVNVLDTVSGTFVNISTYTYFNAERGQYHHRNSNRVPVYDTLERCGRLVSTDEYQCDTGRYITSLTNKVFVMGDNGKYIHVTKEEYRNNPNYVTTTHGKCIARRVSDGKIIQINVSELDNDLYVSIFKGRVNAYSHEENRFVSISCDEYHNNKEKYSSISAGKTIAYDSLYDKNVLVDAATYKNNRERYASIFTDTVNAKKVGDIGGYKRMSREEFNSGEYITPTTGSLVVYDSNDRVYKRIKSDEYKNDSMGRYISIMKGTLTVFDKANNEYKRVRCEDYANNRDRFFTRSSLDITVINRENGERCSVPIETYRENKDVYKCLYEGMVNVKDENGKSARISKEEYANNKDKYRNATQGKREVYDYSKSKIVKIFQEEINKNPTNFVSKSEALELKLVERKKIVIDVALDKVVHVNESELAANPEKYIKATADKRYKNGKREIKKRT